MFVALDHLDVLRVHRSSLFPTLEDFIPRDRLVKQPAFFLRIVLDRELVVDCVLALAGVEIRRPFDADALAQRHRCAHPHLPMLVVGQAFEFVVKLILMFFQIIRQAELFQGHRKHPVHGALQSSFSRTAGFCQGAHPAFSVPQM